MDLRDIIAILGADKPREDDHLMVQQSAVLRPIGHKTPGTLLRYDVVATDDLACASQPSTPKPKQMGTNWVSCRNALHDVPEWRNWQTRGTQNPVRLKPRGGSTPPSGTSAARG